MNFTYLNEQISTVAMKKMYDSGFELPMFSDFGLKQSSHNLGLSDVVILGTPVFVSGEDILIVPDGSSIQGYSNAALRSPNDQNCVSVGSIMLGSAERAKNVIKFNSSSFVDGVKSGTISDMVNLFHGNESKATNYLNFLKQELNSDESVPVNFKLHDLVDYKNCGNPAFFESGMTFVAVKPGKNSVDIHLGFDKNVSLDYLAIEPSK